MNTPDPNGATPPSYSAQCRARAEDYVRKRGVLLETFTSHGGEIDYLLGWGRFCQRLKRGDGKGRCDPAWNELESILWFRVSSFNGELAHYIARALPNGFKGAKFLASNGSDSLPWIPYETQAVARDAAVPLVLTEGPIKGMALLQAGAFPVAFVGVWMGAGTKKKANPDGLEEYGEDAGVRDGDNAKTLKLHSAIAENFKLWKRSVYVCFDADSSKNKNVRHAEIRTWLLLHAAGADVFQLSWPLAEGKGIDDYLAGRAGTDPEKQREAFGALREKAVPFLETLDSHDIPMLTTELPRTHSESAVLEELIGKIARKLKVPKASLAGTTQKDLSGAKEFKIPPTATPWDEELKPVEVLDQICEALRRFVWMKPSEYRAVALWIVLSYLHDVVNILPILLVTSPEEVCGKSTLSELIYDLSNRPLGASNVSSAAIYRTIKDNCPTFIMDEADTYLKDDEVMRGIINSGHKRAFAFVIRVVNDKGDTGQFSTWCPKVIAMISLPKRTILSRSVHIRLGRKPKDIKTDKLKEDHYQEFEDLRRKISRLANDIRSHVKAFRDESLENRAGDNWQPLFAIAAAAGEEWLQEAKLAAQRLSKKDAEEMKGFGRYLLESLDAIIQEKRKKENVEPTEKIFLRSLDLCNELNQDQEAPWKDKPDGIDALRLSKALKEYDIVPKRTREGADRSKGYWSDEIEKVVQQYARSPD
jgi:hypothetical protein